MDHFEKQAIDLEAKLNQKIVDYEGTRFENSQVKAVLDSRDQFNSDSDRIKSQYGRIITDNLQD